MSHALSTNKALSTPVIISTSIGVVMGLLFAVGFNSMSASRVSAIEKPAVSSQASADDFAKFAYAYTQGYEARTASSSGGAAACVDVPSMPGGMGGASASSEATAEGAVASAVAAPVTQAASRGSAVLGSKWNAPAGTKHYSSHHGSYQDRIAQMVNSYNTYNSSTAINNTSSVTNTNSNNTVGSHNSSSNEVRIEDARGVLVGINTNQETTSNQASNSFNTDSYNTSTTTTTNVANDSFNTTTNTAIDSGNTTTENTAVNVVDDSYNTDDHTTNTNTTTNTTVNDITTTDSYNNTEVGVDVNVEDNVVIPVLPVAAV